MESGPENRVNSLEDLISPSDLWHYVLKGNGAHCDSESPQLFASLPDCSWLSCWVLLDITSSSGGFRAPQRRCWNKPTRSRGSTTGSLQNPSTDKPNSYSFGTMSHRRLCTRTSAKFPPRVNRQSVFRPSLL